MAVAKTISLVRGPGAQPTEGEMFRQMFARNMGAALSARNVVPLGDGGKVEKLATMLNTDPETVSNWLYGRALPNAFELQKLAKLLNIPADALLNPDHKTDGPVIDEDYHCITLHDESSEEGFSIYTLPETLRHLNLPRSTMMMSVNNDDMSPMFKTGDVVIYDPRVTGVTTNGVYVLRAQGASIVRRVEKVSRTEFSLYCENAAILPVSLTLGDFTTNPENEAKTFVLGRVLGRINIGSLSLIES